jgi:hypothetical protein
MAQNIQIDKRAVSFLLLTGCRSPEMADRRSFDISSTILATVTFKSFEKAQMLISLQTVPLAISDQTEPQKILHRVRASKTHMLCTAALEKV